MQSHLQLHVVFMPAASMQALMCGPHQDVFVGADIILASILIIALAAAQCMELAPEITGGC
eukprot:1156949-Pelagomonas_calceolata.AAC.7